MKKILFICLVFVFIVFGIFILADDSDSDTAIGEFSDLIFKDELEEYNNDFEINRLKLKNQSFYYNSLSSENKKIYTAIANGIKKFNKSIALKEYEIIDNDTTMSDIDKSMQAFFADHPEVFYVSSKYTVLTKTTAFNEYVELELEYTLSNSSELDTKIGEIENKINEYIEYTKDKDDFESELILHDMLGKNVKYYEYNDVELVPQECHTIYGAFLSNQSVCDGFSKALQILLDRKGIESIIVFGNLENEAHAWNLVNLNNSWYHLDLTSDKSIKDISENIVLHTYFNLTTNAIKGTHTIDSEEILPISNNEEYNYYIKKNKVLKFEDVFMKKFKSLLDNNENQYLLEFSSSDVDDVPEQMVKFLSRNQYTDYISNNKITYYNILNTYVLMKNK